MRLNVGKCKVIFINPPRVLGSSVPTIYLLGQMLETVNISALSFLTRSTSIFNRDVYAQLSALSSSCSSSLSSMAGLRRCSSVYTDHFTYSAVMLTSTSAAAKCEMNAFNSRLWRIMGIDDQTAGFYKLFPIAEFIDHVCEQTLNRILADPNHPITIPKINIINLECLRKKLTCFLDIR
ncbi:hypothetical protein BpHYR1_013768 [Brachionus plicatilis]|uniref:Uncharacterized protein n=1 Tax=Brachionus plicatilis TaxID=10195 RepID=A0A3M7RAL8_BRAPC|nr:hypothetical protein BpHYR1_013768 [Brachionus plicatilis]